MRTARLILAALLAASVAPAARAQFQPLALRVAAWPRSELIAGNWSGAASPDLLVLQAAGATSGRLLHHGDLLASYASPYGAPAGVRAGAFGRLDAGSTGAIPDAAWGVTNGLAVSWGEAGAAAPYPYDAFGGLFAFFVDGMAAIRMLPRLQPVVLVNAGTGEGLARPIYAVDLAGARGPPATAPSVGGGTLVSWTVPDYVGAYDGDQIDRIYPLRLSPGAIAGGVDDAFVPFDTGFLLLWHSTAPAGATLADLDVAAVRFGAVSGGDLAPYLPAPLDSTFWFGSILGGAANDVDGDGLPDLVVSYGHELYPAMPGQVLWIRNTGDAATMSAAANRWGSLMGRGDLPVGDASTLRQLDLGDGTPAFAVFDRTLERIFVVRGNAATGFDVESLPAPGVLVREMIATDVVGSPEKDLVVLVDLAPGYTTSEVWVFPDDDDVATVLAWDPPLPAAALLGTDLPLGVALQDPDTLPADVAVSWLRPVSPETVAATGTTWTVPGADLCTATSWDFKVRALDPLGVYTELSASIPVLGEPSLLLVGGGPLVLPPGGATGRAEGEAWPECATGAATYTWGQVGLAGLLQAPCDPAGTASACIDFTVPEAAYPGALAATPALTLAATGPTAAGTISGTATLSLALDARGLVAASVAFDQAALAEGEVGLARIRLASRLGVPLPAVRAQVRLAGLAFAGPVEISGAPGEPGAMPGEFVVDPLPAAPATIEVRVPVRSLGEPGGVAVELFSEGGFRLSPEAAPAAGDALPPGCGCGGGGSGGLGLLLALAAAARRRRRPT
jgi:MYXO-CTERM domain-containing protein